MINFWKVEMKDAFWRAEMKDVCGVNSWHGFTTSVEYDSNLTGVKEWIQTYNFNGRNEHYNKD